MENILLKSESGISYITLNRPDSYNALDESTLKQLLQVLKTVENNKDKVVILSGNGNAFCAGGDINMMGGFADKEFFDDLMETIEQIALCLYRMPKLIISAISGSAAGLGLSLGLIGDYVVAENQAKFGMLFLGVGLVPDGGGHFWLEERMGIQRAKQFIWGMKQVQGEEAQALGLVDVLVKAKAVEHATKLGHTLLASPIQSMLQTKRIYRSTREDVLKQYLAEERKAQWELKDTIDHKEGVTAFLEKRQPVFKGE